MTVTHTLNTIYPTIHFVQGSNVNIRKRCVRLYQGQLCVSARGALYSVKPVGPRTCKCDLTTPPLVNFGSRKHARAQAQSVAPVATLANLGIDRTPKPATRHKANNDRVDPLTKVSKAITQTLAAYTT
jgi:hypothetical protein